MRHLVVFALAALFLSPRLALADWTCDDNEGRICVETIQSDTGVTVFAENRYPYLTVTLSLSYTAENMRVPSAAEGPFVLKGGSRTELATLSAIKAGAWSYRYNFSWSRGDINAQHDASYRYRLPYAEGAAFPLMQSCDGSFSHTGLDRYALDFFMPIGTPIHAARAGRVVAVKDSSNRGGPTEDYRKDGNFVVIEHADGTLAQYFHLSQGGALVEAGERVTRGQRIALSGNTGLSTGPHLHFDVVKGGLGRRSETLPIRLETQAGTAACPPVGSRLIAAE